MVVDIIDAVVFVGEDREDVIDDDVDDGSDDGEDGEDDDSVARTIISIGVVPIGGADGDISIRIGPGVIALAERSAV